MQVRNELPDLGSVIALEIHDGSHTPVAFGGAGDPERLAEDKIDQLGLQQCMAFKVTQVTEESMSTALSRQSFCWRQEVLSCHSCITDSDIARNKAANEPQEVYLTYLIQKALQTEGASNVQDNTMFRQAAEFVTCVQVSTSVDDAGQLLLGIHGFKSMYGVFQQRVCSCIP